jgi:hypothetical protein
MTIEYTVRLIDGDYAHLADSTGAEILIARALLPDAIDEGSRLLFEDFVYTLLD